MPINLSSNLAFGGRINQPPAGLGGTLAVAYGTVAYTDTVAKTLFTLPAGAIPVFWQVNVSTAFNAGTSNLLDIGNATVADRFANDLNVGTAGQINAGFQVAVLDVQLTSDTPIRVLFVPSGTAASAGAASVKCFYLLASG